MEAETRGGLLYRQPELKALFDAAQVNPQEAWAQRHDLAYVALHGDIGCMVNGAGLAMATMDIIKLYGAAPANFLDVGGSANAEAIENAFRILLSDQHVKAVLINIFGGITRCDDIARGILMARERLSIPVPLVIRLIGTNEAEGRDILKGAGIDAYEDLTEAVKGVVGRAASTDGKGSRT